MAALCSPCNAAIRRRKLIPVFFHNGGGYDFHFLVRAIAHLKQEQAVESESSDSEELSLDELEYLADLQFEECEVSEQLVNWKELKFEVLVKSGERYLQVRLGPLLFLDSCNIFSQTSAAPRKTLPRPSRCLLSAARSLLLRSFARTETAASRSGVCS